MAEDIYCTLLMSDSYLPGAAVLAHSLRDNGTKKKLGVLVTPDTLLHSTLQEVQKLYDYVIPVERIANPNLENLARLERLDLRFAFTKIALWRQERFRKIVYIDADVVALRAPDELFDIDAPMAAAPDIGWPDIFNSGVMVLTPGMGEYWSLETLASSGTSFDGADQGLLNEHFGNRPWQRISFTYNCTPSPSYQYEPAYRHFRSSISMVHFIGKEKPWSQGRGPLSSSDSAVYRELYGRWWAVYDRHYRIFQSSALGQVSIDKATVPRYVNDEQSHLAALSWASAGMPTLEQGAVPATAVPSVMQQESNAATRGGAQSPAPPPPVPEPTPEPTRRSDGRAFSPPRMQWDATRDAPPVESTPEAADFPLSQYQMSKDTALFHPPRYAEPPRNMYYKVPEIQPMVQEPPKPIFPWETSPNKPKPTRVFEDDQAQQNSAAINPIPTASPRSQARPPTPEWSQVMRGNAWDNISSIDLYIRAMKDSQARRGQVQVIHHQGAASPSHGTDITSPTGPPIGRQQRRESLILTDFPTEIERPSLPVTPAPIRRPTFWGEERDSVSDLPSAQGVPEQAAWNPMERLEQLRKASLITAEELPQSAPEEDFPIREMPKTSLDPAGALPDIAPTVAPSTSSDGATQNLLAFDFSKASSDSVAAAMEEGAASLAAREAIDSAQIPPGERSGDEYSIA